MSRKPPWIFLGFILLLIPFFGAAQEWDANNFPNPTAGQFQQCNMKTTASICDPDKILSESQRYRLNHELNQLEARTRQDHGGNFCEKKGVTGAMAVAKHFRGGTEQAVKEAANAMLRKWDLDRQCQKAVVIVLATEDRKFWVARGDRVPVYAGEFTELFDQQKSQFKGGNYEQGLLNILQGTWEKALSKQTGGVPSGPSGPSGPGGKKQPPPFGGDTGGRDAPEFKMPKIPWGTIAALLIIIIPIVLCCCCIYCCCCKGKGGSNRRGDVEGGSDQGGGMMGGGGGGPRGGGGGGGGLSSFLGGMGGSAALNGIMSMIRNRSGGGGGRGGGGYPMDPMGGYSGGGGGGGYPGGGGTPTRHGDNPGGKGLYPSVAKADEGGGGSW